MFVFGYCGVNKGFALPKYSSSAGIFLYFCPPLPKKILTKKKQPLINIHYLYSTKITVKWR